MKRTPTGFVATALVGLLALGAPSLALAQKNSANNAGSNGAAAKAQGSLDTSKRVKFKDKTNVDFDAANIDGSAKSPFGTVVNSRDQDFNKGFIKLRYHWHDQMVMSLSGLSGN